LNLCVTNAARDASDALKSHDTWDIDYAQLTRGKEFGRGAFGIYIYLLLSVIYSDNANSKPLRGCVHGSMEEHTGCGKAGSG
jgi:hypothetical protein